MQLLVKEKEEQIALNKGSTIPTKEKRRVKQTRTKGPTVSHQRHHGLTWGEYINSFLNILQKIFFYSVLLNQFNVLLLIIVLYCHKIGEYINKDHSFQQNFDSKKESDKWTVQSLIKEKEVRIDLNNGPIISLARKGGTKKQSPKILLLPIKGTAI